MPKIALILVLGYSLLTSCLVFKNAEKTKIENSAKSFSEIDLEKIVDKNITKQNFFISKADIEISGSEGNEKGLLNLKYIFPGEYLLSLKSRTGIEVARIYISRDTVLVNDRINRRLYYGSNEDLFKKYGLDQSIIPILFGDFVPDDYVNEKFEVCMNGTLEKESNVGGTKIHYILDCKRLKVVSAVAQKEEMGEPVKVNFSGFKKVEKTLIPGVIEIRNIRKIKRISLKIRKLEYPWEGSINFVPGLKYDAIPLK